MISIQNSIYFNKIKKICKIIILARNIIKLKKYIYIKNINNNINYNNKNKKKIIKIFILNKL
jgi:hypothetical protein